MEGSDTFRNISLCTQNNLAEDIRRPQGQVAFFFQASQLLKLLLQIFTHTSLLIHPGTEPASTALIGRLKTAQLHALHILCLKKDTKPKPLLKITGLSDPDIIIKVQLVMFLSWQEALLPALTPQALLCIPAPYQGHQQQLQVTSAHAQHSWTALAAQLDQPSAQPAQSSLSPLQLRGLHITHVAAGIGQQGQHLEMHQQQK